MRKEFSEGCIIETCYRTYDDVRRAIRIECRATDGYFDVRHAVFWSESRISTLQFFSDMSLKIIREEHKSTMIILGLVNSAVAYAGYQNKAARSPTRAGRSLKEVQNRFGI